MPIYSVHSRTADPLADTGKVRFVKEGFSWWGLFFPLPWLVIKGMWLVLVIAIAAQLLLIALAEQLGLSDSMATILGLIVNLIVGFEGYDLYRWTLKRRGFHEAGLTSGDNFDDAEFRYFASLPPRPRPEPAPAQPRILPTRDLPDPLGLFSQRA
jgi:hypothetical protein